MTFPMLSGEVARLLGTTEPKLAETVRRGRVSPPPPVVSGRRLWTCEHIERAASALGVTIPPDALEQRANGQGSVRS